jgi:hypothetical protein
LLIATPERVLLENHGIVQPDLSALVINGDDGGLRLIGLDESTEEFLGR